MASGDRGGGKPVSFVCFMHGSKLGRDERNSFETYVLYTQMEIQMCVLDSVKGKETAFRRISLFPRA